MSDCLLCDGAGSVYAEDSRDPRDAIDCEACAGTGEVLRCVDCGSVLEDGACDCEATACRVEAEEMRGAA